MRTRSFAAALAGILACCLTSKLSLWVFGNRAYSAKVCAYLPLFWSLGKPVDPALGAIGEAIEKSLLTKSGDLAQPAPSAKPPQDVNVLLLTVESLRADAIDSEVAPFLDSLGRESLVFANHYSAANCTPYSLFSILTGRWPSEYESFLDGGGDPLCFKTFPGREYLTGNHVSWSLWNQERTLFRKFAIVDCGPGPASSDSAMMASFFARLAPPRRKPFFGVLMLNATHFGYTVDERRIVRSGYFRNAFDMRTASPAWMPAIKNRYLNSVHLVDALARDVFRRLDSLGLSRNTLVAVVGDHGEEFMESGKFTHSSEVNRWQTHVPLIIRYGGFRGRFTGYSSHVQMDFFLRRLLSGDPESAVTRDIAASLAPMALAFNSVPLPDDADEFGAIGDGFELRMRWNGARLEVYDARFEGRAARLTDAEAAQVGALLRKARVARDKEGGAAQSVQAGKPE